MNTVISLSAWAIEIPLGERKVKTKSLVTHSHRLLITLLFGSYSISFCGKPDQFHPNIDCQIRELRTNVLMYAHYWWFGRVRTARVSSLKHKVSILLPTSRAGTEWGWREPNHTQAALPYPTGDTKTAVQQPFGGAGHNLNGHEPESNWVCGG